MSFAILGQVVQGLGQVRQGRAAGNIGEYNGALSDRDAAVARDQATSQAIRQNRMSRKAIGSMRAGYGASGITIEGSALDVIEESAGQAELDNLTIRYLGELKAIGAESNAALSRYKGKEAENSGYMGAAGTLLSSFGGKSGGSSSSPSSTSTSSDEE
jgi:hypothetical protein